MEEKVSKSTNYELDSIINSNSNPPNDEVTVAESNPDPATSNPLDYSFLKNHCNVCVCH